MSGWQRVLLTAAAGVVLTLGAGPVWSAAAQEEKPTETVEIPAEATRLEGRPTVRVESTEGGTTRRALDETEAARSRVLVEIVDGKFVLASQGNRPLTFNTAGPFTYLSSRPGHYIRFRKLGETITYVEHLDGESGTVTFFGELRFGFGNR